MNPPAQGCYFEEVQGLWRPLLWVVMAVVALTVVIVFACETLPQVHAGRPWGPAVLEDLAALGVILATLGIILPLLLSRFRLRVRVEPNHLQVHWVPFIYKSIPLTRITRWQAVTYRPLRDFGGWGIRRAWNGSIWAYTISGNRGVRLEFTEGKPLLIGSQRAEELAAALTAAKSVT